MHFVYIIFSEKHSRHYTGLTINIDQRLHEHNSGQNKSTKPYRPWKLIHSEAFPTRSEARQREKYYKSGIGREKIKEFHDIKIKDS